MSFSFTGKFPDKRPRRMRRDDFSRRMMRETVLTPDDFIYPVFVLDGARREEPVPSLPGVSRKSVDLLFRDAEQCIALGVPAIALFPVIDRSLKSADASQAWRSDDLVPRAVRALKSGFPSLGVITIMSGTQRRNVRSRLPLCVAPSGPTRPARSMAKSTGSRCRATSWTSWSKARCRNVE